MTWTWFAATVATVSVSLRAYSPSSEPNSAGAPARTRCAATPNPRHMASRPTTTAAASAAASRAASSALAAATAAGAVDAVLTPGDARRAAGDGAVDRVAPAPVRDVPKNLARLRSKRYVRSRGQQLATGVEDAASHQGREGRPLAVHRGGAQGRGDRGGVCLGDGGVSASGGVHRRREVNLAAAKEEEGGG